MKDDRVQRVMVVYDQVASPAPQVARTVSPAGQEVFLVNVGRDWRLSTRLKEAFECSGAAAVHEIPLARRLQRKGLAIRRWYLGLIAGLGRRRVDSTNVVDLLRRPGSSSSMWWFSALTEKNVVSSMTFHDLALTMALLDLEGELRCERTVLFIDRPWVREVLESKREGRPHTPVADRLHRPVHFYVRAVKTFLLHSVRILLACRYLKPPAPGRLRRLRYVAVTYFPYLDRERLERDEFVNLYYGPLQRALEQMEPSSHAWFCLTLDECQGSRYPQAVQIAHRLSGRYPIYLYEQFLGLLDLVAVLWAWLAAVFRLGRHGRLIAQATLRLQDHEIPLQHLLFPDLITLCGPQAITSLLEQFAFRRFFARLGNDVRILYLAEMYGWERGMLDAARERGIHATVGLQHTTVPPLWLTYFDMPDQIAGNSSLPSPSLLGCSGEVPRQRFSACGWPPERLFVFGSPRYHDLRSQQGLPWQLRPPRILAAAPLGRRHLLEFFEYVEFAFEEGLEDVEVRFLFHPGTGAPRSVLERCRDRYGVFNGPLSAHLPTARLVVVSQTAANLDGLAYQCPSIVCLMPGTVNYHPLPDERTVRFVGSPIELRGESLEIVCSSENPYPPAQYAEVLRRHCDFADSDCEYLERVEQALNRLREASATRK